MFAVENSDSELNYSQSCNHFSKSGPLSMSPHGTTLLCAQMAENAVKRCQKEFGVVSPPFDDTIRCFMVIFIENPYNFPYNLDQNLKKSGHKTEGKAREEV